MPRIFGQIFPRPLGQSTASTPDSSVQQRGLTQALDIGALQPYLRDRAIYGVSHRLRQAAVGHATEAERLARMLAKNLNVSGPDICERSQAILCVVGNSRAALTPALNFVHFLKHGRAELFPAHLRQSELNTLIVKLVAVRHDVPLADAAKKVQEHEAQQRLPRAQRLEKYVLEMNTDFFIRLARPLVFYDRCDFYDVGVGHGMLSVFAARLGAILVVAASISMAKGLTRMHVVLWPSDEEQAQYRLLKCTGYKLLRR